MADTLNDTERAAFEAYANRNGLSIHRDASGYEDDKTAWTWDAWKACARLRTTLASPPEAPADKPVAYKAVWDNGAWQVIPMDEDAWAKCGNGAELYLRPASGEADRRDAARYRWMQGHYSGLFCSDGRSGSCVTFSESLDQPTTFVPSLLDAAIDAELAKGEQG